MATVVQFRRTTTLAGKQVSVEFEPEFGVLWSYMDAKPRPCFNRELLRELGEFDREFIRNSGRVLHTGQLQTVDYLVFASKTPGIYSLGGDLDLFRRAIIDRDRQSLKAYAYECIEDLYPRLIGYGLPVITVALLQGDAFGGGFECALGAQLLIAERRARMSFPEVLFNLFPGMGAYHLLARKVGTRHAEEMIMSGAVYSAERLFNLGVVDILAEDGEGELAIYKLVETYRNRHNSLLSMQRVKNVVNPITYDDLLRVTDVWVDSALRLTPRDLKLMGRLVTAQERLMQRTSTGTPGTMPHVVAAFETTPASGSAESSAAVV